AGDEFLNSQQGNNNAYCQDNATSWLDWEQAGSEAGLALIDFVARVRALRRAHPSLRLTRYDEDSTEVRPGLPRLSWYDMDAKPMSEAAWAYAEGRVLGLRRAVETRNGTADASFVLLNGGPQDI